MSLRSQDGSNRLWIFAFGAYWLTFTTLYVLWNAYKQVVELRTHAKSVDTSKPEQYAVLFRDIPVPRSANPKDVVDAFLGQLHPDSYESSIIITSAVSKVIHPPCLVCIPCLYLSV
jgi:hypothetical protein